MTTGCFPACGRRASLVWYQRRIPDRSEGPARTYIVEPLPAGPSLSALVLAAPRTLSSFEVLLRERQGERDDWRRFLSCCRLVEGEMSRDGRRIHVWRDEEALAVLEALCDEMVAEEIRRGTGPALLPVPGGRTALNEGFLSAIRRNEPFLGWASEQPGPGALHLWAVPQEEHLNVVLLFQDMGDHWNVLLNPFRIPAGVVRGPP